MPKYKTLTLYQKVCLIEEASKSTCSNKKLAEKHDVPLLMPCIMKNKPKILEVYGKTHSSKHSLVWFPLYPDKEDALITWFQCATAAHLPVNGMIL